jgi:DNA-binding MarR family transcriptional regulator
MMGRRARVELGEHLHLTLALLGTGQPMRVSELAEQLDVERSTVSRRVGQLIDQGLVVRSVDEKDHRAALLSLTLPGQRALARIRDAWHQTLLDLTDGWRARDRAETTSRLSRLADGLETLLAG